MKFNKLAFVIAFVLTAILFAEVAAHAEEAHHPTLTMLNQPAGLCSR